MKKNMVTFKITKNGKDIENGLTEKEANNKFFIIVEDNSIGYIYDNEEETIYNEVSRLVIAEKGDNIVRAGDDIFEIILNLESF